MAIDFLQNSQNPYVFPSRSLRIEIGSTRHVPAVLPFLLTVLLSRPSAQLQSGGAERQALGVRGGADAAAAAGGARRLPAGAAPVQLPAPVRSALSLPSCSGAPASPARTPQHTPP